MKRNEPDIDEILERSLPSLSKEQLESARKRILNRVRANAAADWDDVRERPVVDSKTARTFGWRWSIVGGAFAAAALLLILFTRNHVPDGPSPGEMLQTGPSSAAALKSGDTGRVTLDPNTRNHVSEGPSWEVTGLPGTDRLRPGDMLQTGPSSSAQVKIANIGRLMLDPNTRIRLLVTQANEHRIALDRGKLEASTSSPPRVFVVETPSATAVDLGCRYTLEVQDDGSSLLHVLHGLVALERGGRESIVPAGAFSRSRSGAEPGTPFYDDSSAELQSALGQVDSLKEGPERTRQLDIVLQHARARDALSLWHLIPKLDFPSRGLLYDRLAQLRPPPAGVTRDGIMALDAKMLNALKKIVPELRQKNKTP